jgi:hypothetical protein
MSPQQATSEEILCDVGANLFRGVEAVGGRLKITNQRLVFQPHALNVQTMPLEIAMPDIAAATKRNTLGFVPNGMLVRTRAGVEYKFVVWGRGRILDILNSRIGPSSV